MRWVTAVLAAAICLTACDPDEPDCVDVAADCTTQLRVDAVVYDQIGYARAAAKPAGEADLSTCSDVGRCARGSYFSADPKQVAVSVIEGYPRGRVLATQGPDGMLAIFIAQNVARRTAERILAEMHRR